MLQVLHIIFKSFPWDYRQLGWSALPKGATEAYPLSRNSCIWGSFWKLYTNYYTSVKF